MNQEETSRAPRPFRGAIVKWLALKSPTRWPKGIPTRPEIEQGKGGTPPSGFEADRAKLLRVIEVFCDSAPETEHTHPIFGKLTREEWLRWGWLHTDHHLRQFGR